MAMLRRMVTSGDPISRVAGCFSGTLGFVMSGLEAGKKLSDVVAEAKSLGYTEPDPREDLSGMDVARKALIIARSMGWKLEMDDVKVSVCCMEKSGAEGATCQCLSALCRQFIPRLCSSAVMACHPSRVLQLPASPMESTIQNLSLGGGECPPPWDPLDPPLDPSAPSNVYLNTVNGALSIWVPLSLGGPCTLHFASPFPPLSCSRLFPTLF